MYPGVHPFISQAAVAVFWPQWPRRGPLKQLTPRRNTAEGSQTKPKCPPPPPPHPTPYAPTVSGPDLYDAPRRAMHTILTPPPPPLYKLRQSPKLIRSLRLL